MPVLVTITAAQARSAIRFLDRTTTRGLEEEQELVELVEHLDNQLTTDQGAPT